MICALICGIYLDYKIVQPVKSIWFNIYVSSLAVVGKSDRCVKFEYTGCFTELGIRNRAVVSLFWDF